MYSVKFILLNVGKWSNYGDFGWLGVRYIASELKKETDIQVSACMVHEQEWPQLLPQIVGDKPDIIAFPAIQQNLKLLKNVSDYMKANLPNSTIIIGNIEATIRPEVLLTQMKSVDIACIGEGEYTFRELVALLKEKKEIAVCKGIAYRNSYNEIILTEPRPLEREIDRFSFPDREIIPNRHKVFDIITSRGCRGNCSFCANKTFQKQPGAKVRVRSLKNVMDEIMCLIKHYKASYISISDDTFGDNSIKRGFDFDTFHEELENRKINIRYRIQLRSENINIQSVMSLKKMLISGLDNIFIGFETGNTDDMKLYRKIASMEDNVAAMNLLNQYDIPYSMGFIMFNPYSTKDRLYQNIQFLKHGNCIITPYVLCSRLELFNGAKILEDIMASGLITEGLEDPLTDTYHYRFIHPELQQTWEAFYLLNNLPVNFIQLDQINAYFRYVWANNHPIKDREVLRDAKDAFHLYTHTMKHDLLKYGEMVLQMKDGLRNEIAIENLYKELSDKVQRSHELIEFVIKTVEM